MSDSFEIVELDFSQRNLQVDAALRLFEEEDLSKWEEVFSDATKEARLERTRGWLSGQSNYGVINLGGLLVAAASVDHQRTTDPSLNEPFSEVFFLSVYPRERGQGYGLSLMRHIAEQSIEFDDSLVRCSGDVAIHGVDGIKFLWKHGFHAMTPGQFEAQPVSILERA